MEEMVKSLNSQYVFNLSEEEIGLIAQQVEANDRLFQKLYEVDLSGTMPMMKIDRKRAKK